MPANLDDPASATIYRVSGEPPYPDPSEPQLPEDIKSRLVTLRDRQTIATIVPFASRDQLPPSLAVYLCDQLNKEIDGGDTYPMMERFTPDSFARYWFQNFGAVMLLGEIAGAEQVTEGKDWAKECLGSFYIKPNYPGRSSHVCNAGFLVTDASRNRGVGRLMGEAYIDWAPRLGYTYSVFNLVYETNVASCRIWDALGFKRIGRVKGCGNLRSYPDRLIDAIIYGRDLAPGESEELVSEERFDKIKFYLKSGKYPNGADRAEKSRLRSAATHYKLTEGDKLMLKDKEVISDPGKQYQIAREVHLVQHAGINRTTSTIAEKYHWSRIKETVSDVIRNCTDCKEASKTPNVAAGGRNFPNAAPRDDGSSSQNSLAQEDGPVATAGMMPSISQDQVAQPRDLYAHPSELASVPSSQGYASSSEQALPRNPMLQDHPVQHFPSVHYDQTAMHTGLSRVQGDSSSHPGHHNHDDHSFEPYDAQFQALLNATDDDLSVMPQVHYPNPGEHDLDMLMDPADDRDDLNVEGRGDRKYHHSAVEAHAKSASNRPDLSDNI